MMVDNNFRINNKTNRRCDINKTGSEKLLQILICSTFRYQNTCKSFSWLLYLKRMLHLFSISYRKLNMSLEPTDLLYLSLNAQNPQARSTARKKKGIKNKEEGKRILQQGAIFFRR